MLCITLALGLFTPVLSFTAAEGCQSPSISISFSVIMSVVTGGCMQVDVWVVYASLEVLIYMLNPSTSEVFCMCVY